MKRVYTSVVLAALLVLTASVALAQREARPEEATAPQLTAEERAVLQEVQDLRKQLEISRLELALAEAKDAPLSEIAERAEQVYRTQGQLYALRVKNPDLAAELRPGRGRGGGPGGGRGLGQSRGRGMGGRGMGRRGHRGQGGEGMGRWGVGPEGPQGPGGPGLHRHGWGRGEGHGLGGCGLGQGRRQGTGQGRGQGLGRGRGLGFGPQLGSGGGPMGPAWHQCAPEELPMPMEPEALPEVEE